MEPVIAALSSGVPTALTEIVTPARTKQRATDARAYLYRPGTDNGPTEAINAARASPRLRTCFRNLTTYIARCLLETGGFRPRLHRGL